MSCCVESLAVPAAPVGVSAEELKGRGNVAFGEGKFAAAVAAYS
jgi:hypothetical protein